jgi:hypothetical protein
MDEECEAKRKTKEVAGLTDFVSNDPHKAINGSE